MKFFIYVTLVLASIFLLFSCNNETQKPNTETPKPNTVNHSPKSDSVQTQVIDTTTLIRKSEVWNPYGVRLDSASQLVYQNIKQNHFKDPLLRNLYLTGALKTTEDSVKFTLIFDETSDEDYNTTCRILFDLAITDLANFPKQVQYQYQLDNEGTQKETTFERLVYKPSQLICYHAPQTKHALIVLANDTRFRYVYLIPTIDSRKLTQLLEQIPELEVAPNTKKMEFSQELIDKWVLVSSSKISASIRDYIWDMDYENIMETTSLEKYKTIKDSYFKNPLLRDLYTTKVVKETPKGISFNFAFDFPSMDYNPINYQQKINFIIPKNASNPFPKKLNYTYGLDGAVQESDKTTIQGTFERIAYIPSELVCYYSSEKKQALILLTNDLRFSYAYLINDVEMRDLLIELKDMSYVQITPTVRKWRLSQRFYRSQDAYIYSRIYYGVRYYGDSPLY